MNVVLMDRVKCEECPIRHRAVCARCNDEELAKLDAIKTYRSFKAGDPIFWRGDDLPYVASIVKGVATLSKSLPDGRTQTVGLMLPSDFIGRPGRSTIDYDVAAATDIVLCCFERKPFEKIAEKTPHLSQRLMEIALDELDAARDWMVLLGRKTAREKMATFIEMFVRRSQASGLTGANAQLQLPLTRDDMANYLGLTLETVSRQLSRLKAEGVIRFVDRRRFEVLDINALYLAAGADDDGAMIA